MLNNWWFPVPSRSRGRKNNRYKTAYKWPTSWSLWNISLLSLFDFFFGQNEMQCIGDRNLQFFISKDTLVPEVLFFERRSREPSICERRSRDSEAQRAEETFPRRVAPRCRGFAAHKSRVRGFAAQKIKPLGPGYSKDWKLTIQLPIFFKNLKWHFLKQNFPKWNFERFTK